MSSAGRHSFPATDYPRLGPQSWLCYTKQASHRDVFEGGDVLDLRYAQSGQGAPLPRPAVASPAVTAAVRPLILQTGLPSQVPAPTEPVQELTAQRGVSASLIWGVLSLLALPLITAGVASFLTAQSEGAVTRQTEVLRTLSTELTGGALGAQLAELQLTERQLAIFGASATQTIPWSAVLESYRELVPVSAQLTGTAFAAGVVRIEGEAATHQDVAQFMAALSASERFGSVTLTSSALREGATKSLVVFTITASYQSASSAPQATNGGTDA